MKRKLTVMVLALAMVLTMGASVFAGTDDYTGTKNTGTTIKLTKEFDVPQGVEVPTDAFEFTATPVTTSGEVDLVSSSDYPTLTFENISFANSDRVKDTDTTLVKQSSVDLAGLTYKRAGLYEWTITEATTSSDTLTANATGQTYTLRVYVKNGENGTEIETITIEDKGGNKVDGGVTDSDETKDTDEDGNKTNDGNDFRFVNKYLSQDVTTNTDDNNGAFKLTKTTKGDYADKTHEFTFTVNVEFPDGVTAANYTAATKNGEAATVKEGENTVTLADGGVFSITTLPEGTLITVSEGATAHYTPSYTGKHSPNGVATDLKVATADKGEALEVAETIVVGSKGANVDYTNTFDDEDVTPTGIIINNLPYVLLIGLAIGGIVLFTRKRRYE